jgi:uncharacterized protein YjbJ (UPF0337 family)
MTGTNEPSKVGGDLKATGGAIKEKVGHTIGNERMEASGTEKRFEGNAEHDTAQAKQYAEGASDSLLGGLKKQAGKLFGDHQMEGEGAVRQAKGDAKKEINS